MRSASVATAIHPRGQPIVFFGGNGGLVRVSGKRVVSPWRDMAGGDEVGILTGPAQTDGGPDRREAIRIRAAAAARLRRKHAAAPRRRAIPTQYAHRAASRWDIAGGATLCPFARSIICLNDGRATRAPNFQIASSGRRQRRAQWYIARYAETKEAEARDAAKAKSNSTTRKRWRRGAT